MISSYEDILYLPHPISKRHPPMPTEERAAQFSPFAALAGYEEAVEEAARLTEEQSELEEDEKETLDRILEELARGKTLSTIRITYFLPDLKKKGGMYIREERKVRKVDGFRRVLVMEDKTEIPLADIRKIEITEEGTF